MTKHTALKLVLLTLVMLFAVIPARARAEESPASQSALGVSPAIVEQILDPGKPSTITLQVNNVTDFPLPIKGMVRDFTVQSEDLEKTEKSRLDASAWFKLDEPDFILQPKQLRKVTITITPPADAIPGGHYATIFFQPLIPHEALGPATAHLNSQVGVLAFLVVKGDTSQRAEVARPLHTEGLVRGGPIRFTFALKNTGDVHLMPSGNLVIYDWQGKQAAKLDMPAGVVLPEATKEYELAWDAPFALGNYRGELDVTYGDTNTALPKNNVSFWIVPWSELLIIGVFGAGLLILIIKTRGRWRRAWRTLRGYDKRFRI